MTYIAQYQKDPSVTPFGNLRLHIQRHAYKKGAYQGQAPADSSRRAKNHFRVAHVFDRRIHIIFHHCNILTAYEDGGIELRTNGWEDSPTTREAMHHALWLAGYRGWLSTRNCNGFKNTVLHIQTTQGWDAIKWCEGMTIAPDGTLSGYGKIKAYRADKEARKAWREAAQEFKAVLPVLLAGLEAQGRAYHPYGLHSLADAALNPEKWPDLAQYLAYKTGYDVADAWRYLDREATENMRVVVDA